MEGETAWAGESQRGKSRPPQELADDDEIRPLLWKRMPCHSEDGRKVGSEAAGDRRSLVAGAHGGDHLRHCCFLAGIFSFLAGIFGAPWA